MDDQRCWDVNSIGKKQQEPASICHPIYIYQLKGKPLKVRDCANI
jgi:hypothetical protein